LGLLNRYILREVALVWLGVTAVLLMILLGNQVAGVLGQAASAKVPREIVLTLIGLTSIQNLTILIPISLLLAIVLALGRLYHDSEMAAIRACGIGPVQLYRPVFTLAMSIAVLLAGLSWELAPRAFARAQELRTAALRDTQFRLLEPGKFQTLVRDTVFYAESVQTDGMLHHVFLQRQVGDGVEVILADRARHETREGGNLHLLFLYDGEQHQGVPGQAALRRIRFAELTIPVRTTAETGTPTRPEARPTLDLFASSDPKDQAELQWRLGLPLMVLVLALVAVPLAQLRPRQGRYARVGAAILLYFLYSNLIAAGITWIEKGKLSPDLGLWWVHALCVALGLFLLYRQAPPSFLRRKGRAP